VRFELVKKLTSKVVSAISVCRVLEVSPSGYYSWKKRLPSKRELVDKELIEKVKKIHQESRKKYGLPRIKAKLKEGGNCCGNNRVLKLMKLAGVSGLVKKRFKVKTTDSNHSLPIAPRIFKTEDPETHPERLNQIWASDISYIETAEGFLFLAIYLDLFSRKVVGFSTADNMRTELILSALEMALKRQKLLPGASLISHNDQGSQYASGQYRDTLDDMGILASMSRRGNCYDNALAESFFATLKKELIYRQNFQTKQEARDAIFEYIEVWYNRTRIHSSLGFMTPVQFEESLAA